MYFQDYMIYKENMALQFQYLLIFFWPFALIILTIFLFIIGFKKEYISAHPIFEFKDLFSEKIKYWSKDKTIHNSIVLLMLHIFSIMFRIFSPLQYLKILFKIQSNKNNPKGDVPAWFTECYILFWIAYELHLFVNSVTTNYKILISIILAYQSVQVIFNALYYSFLRPAFFGNKTVHQIYRNIILLLINYIELIIIFSLIFFINKDVFFKYDAVAQKVDAIYFSIITITTIGYGDITPIHPIGKIAVAFEALFGTILFVIALSRMIGATKPPDEHIQKKEK